MTAIQIDPRAVVKVTLLLMLSLMAFVLQHHALLVCGAVMCAAYALIANRRSKIKPDQLLFFTALAALFMPALFKPYFGLTPEFYFFNTVSTFLAAIAVTRHPPDVFLWSFRIIYGCSIALIALALYKYWGVPEPFGEIFEGMSTNGIPAYLIVVQIGLSLCNYLVHRWLPVISPLATCAVAYFGYGRGSLVVAGMLVVISVLLNIALWRPDSRWRRLILLLFVVSTVSWLAWSSQELISLLNDYTKLGIGLVDVNRQAIWDQYVNKIDAWTLLFGTDYSGTVIDSAWNGNPHISYIRTHAFFGLPATLLALASPAFVFLSHKTLGAKIVFSSFASVAVLRAASEPILFPTLLDLFYFCFFFLFFRYAPDRNVAVHVSSFRSETRY